MLSPVPWTLRARQIIPLEDLQELQDVRLYLVDLCPAPSAEEITWLLPEERRRAQDFVFEADRRRFLAARAALRACLAAHCGCAPGALVFARQARGKPRVEAPRWCGHFNLSHSGDWALLGSSARAEVGVDLELHRKIEDPAKLARSVCSEAEHAELLAMPEAQRTTGFLDCWTRKEASLKAVGCGLGADLTGVHVGTQRQPRIVELSFGQGQTRLMVSSLSLPIAQASAAVATVLARI